MCALPTVCLILHPIYVCYHIYINVWACAAVLSMIVCWVNETLVDPSSQIYAPYKELYLGRANLNPSELKQGLKQGLIHFCGAE